MKRIDRRGFLALSGGLLLAAPCGSESASSPEPSGSSSTPSGRLRLGFFPNLTHAQPNVGVENGTYARVLGDNVELDMSKTFNSGTTAIEALFAGELDAAYIGPNPAINGFMRSEGKRYGSSQAPRVAVRCWWCIPTAVSGRRRTSMARRSQRPALGIRRTWP